MFSTMFVFVIFAFGSTSLFKYVLDIIFSAIAYTNKKKTKHVVKHVCSIVLLLLTPKQCVCVCVC